MKLRVPALATLPLLCSLATVAFAQADQAPPVKMGLWQTESSTTIEGAPDSPMARAVTHGGRANINQGCLTPETWKSQFEHMQQQRGSANCSSSNFQQDTHHVSLDEQCTDQAYTTSMHFEMLIDDPENAHGHADVKMTGAAFPQGMTMHMTVKTKFLSSSCGDVKPGQGKVIQ